MRDRFGITATTGCNMDPFGHQGSIPQLLRGAGMDSYVFLRPGPHEKELPGDVFWWESADGSRVLAYRIPHAYCGPGDEIAPHLEKSLALLPADAPDLMVFYGVGNHGGGPTKRNLDSIRSLDAAPDTLRCSSIRDYLDAVTASGVEIPTYAGDLQHHAVGCYSVHSGVKQWNRRAENALGLAESWASVATATTGLSYPLAAFTEAWKLVLFNQFHDILAGTAIASAYVDARDQYGHATSIAATAANRAIQSVTRQIAIPAEEDTLPLVVVNPHAFAVRETVLVEMAGRPDAAPHVTDEADGAAVPSQLVASEATVGFRRRLAVEVDLPPLGYRTYRVRPGEPGPQAAPLRASETELGNDLVSLTVDPSTGWLSGLRRAGGPELAGSGAHAVVHRDLSDTWSHGLVGYDDPIGEFRPRSVRLVETGPVRAVLRIESTYGASTLVEELVLGAHAAYVDVRVTLDWHEELATLKLRVPTAVPATTASAEIPFGHLDRGVSGSEEPMQAWVDVAGEIGGRQAGLSVLNDAKYGYDVRGGDIGITAARSPVYAWHDPFELDPEQSYEYVDHGRQTFTYRLVPHAGDWRAAGAVTLAAQLNRPAVALLESYHDGPLPVTASYAQVTPESVVVSAIKQAEDGSGELIVRAYESAGQPTAARIEVLGAAVEADFGAAEIKTFRVPVGSSEPIETDLLERPLAPAEG